MRRCKKDLVHDELVMPLPEASKEPWEMTLKEFVEDIDKKHYRTNPALTRADIRKSSIFVHHFVVTDAVAKGLPVPSEVLADYPDLAEKYGGMTE